MSRLAGSSTRFWLCLPLWFACACVDAFDDSRTPSERPLGEELYGLVCDRVGAQSLRDDLTGESYQNVCHRDAQGKFATKVDASLLPAPSEGVNAQGENVPAAEHEALRERGVARVEALADDRDPLTEAFSAMLPDVTLPEREGCGNVRLYDALQATLSNLVPLYDDQTVPELTRSVGALLARIERDPQVAKALARIGVREGYRADAFALYVLRPLLSYPRLFELGKALAAVHRENRHGARDALAAVLTASAEELREAAQEPLLEEQPLVLTADASTGLSRISRPRSTREISLSLLSKAASADHDAPLSIVKRDGRGLALVAARKGVLPWPFIADERGRPRVDELGRFVTADGRAAPLPFGLGHGRDTFGRALTTDGRLLYDYVGVEASVLSELSASLAPLFVPRADAGSEAMLDALSLLGPLLGRTSESGAGQALSAEASPLVSFVHALTVTLSRPETEDLLTLFSQLARERPDVLARLTRLVLQLDAIADRYPDVHLPTESTLWDELLDVFRSMAANDGLFESLFKAFLDPQTKELGPVLAAYMRNRDELTYYRDPQAPKSRESLNGPVFNLSTDDFSTIKTKVNRDLPDIGKNRSILQRFLQLLHDANGLTACSKEGAIAHVDIRWAGLPVRLDYPTHPLTKAVCAFVGSRAPDKLPECGVLRFDDVASLIIKVALGEYEVTVRDDCLSKLMNSPLTGIVGGANAFLEEISGIDGFNLKPTVQGVARLAFFDAPYESWGGFKGDSYYPKTRDFLKDVIDPVPSMVCPVGQTRDPVDGSPIQLRRCERFEDTLRGRDPNGLFALEQLGFLEHVQSLARAFDDHDATPVFVQLLDVLHLHWGSTAQSRDACDPTLPRTHARWCSQDGVVAYEPMLAEMLGDVNLLGELGELVKVLAEVRIPHCDERDGQRNCARASERDGIAVLAEAARGLFDPSRSPGLLTRHGESRTKRNDGSVGGPVAPVDLWLEALGELRVRLDSDEARRAQWLSARSQLLDRLVTVTDRGGKPQFELRALDTVLPLALSMLREQAEASCPDRSGNVPCAWSTESVRDFSELVEAKVTARLVDTLDALRADEASRNELGRLFAYVLGSEPAAHANIVAALIDLLQVLGDEESLRPLYGLFADALGSEGNQTREVLAPRLLDLFSRFFAEPEGDACAGIDPHQAFAYVLNRAVTPMDASKRAPLEVLLDSALRVNRLDPRDRGVLEPADMQSLGGELAALMLDPASGLEQVYAVLRQATGGSP